MSVEVTPDDLPGAIASCAVVYLLTTSEDRSRPHVGAVAATVVDGIVRVVGVGRTARRDLDAHDAVTLLGAPAAAGGYSLIVDGVGAVVGDQVEVTVRRAVLHRPAPSPEPSADGCSSDCVELSDTGG